MRWLKPKSPPVPERDTEGIRRAREAREDSERAYRETITEVIVPLRRIRQKNNVTAMATELLRQGRGSGGETAH